MCPYSRLGGRRQAQRDPVLKAGYPTLDEEARWTVRVDMPSEEASLVSGHLETVRPALQQHFSEGTLAWEGPQFLVYRPGDYFRPHRDRPVEPEDDVTRRRRISVVVLLNGAGETTFPETFDGGALTFYRLLDILGSGLPATPARRDQPPGRFPLGHPPRGHAREPGERHSIVAWLAET